MAHVQSPTVSLPRAVHLAAGTGIDAGGSGNVDTAKLSSTGERTSIRGGFFPSILCMTELYHTRSKTSCANPDGGIYESQAGFLLGEESHRAKVWWFSFAGKSAGIVYAGGMTAAPPLQFRVRADRGQRGLRGTAIPIQPAGGPDEYHRGAVRPESGLVQIAYVPVCRLRNRIESGRKPEPGVHDLRWPRNLLG